MKLKFVGALEIGDCICAVYHLQLFDQSTIKVQMEKGTSTTKTWRAEWFSIKSFLNEINDHSRHTFKFKNVATVREMILTICINIGNDHVFPGNFPPSHRAVICLVTYIDKITLENKDGFLWPPTSWIMENECPLTNAIVV